MLCCLGHVKGRQWGRCQHQGVVDNFWIIFWTWLICLHVPTLFKTVYGGHIHCQLSHPSPCQKGSPPNFLQTQPNPPHQLIVQSRRKSQRGLVLCHYLHKSGSAHWHSMLATRKRKAKELPPVDQPTKHSNRRGLISEQSKSSVCTEEAAEPTQRTDAGTLEQGNIFNYSCMCYFTEVWVTVATHKLKRTEEGAGSTYSFFWLWWWRGWSKWPNYWQFVNVSMTSAKDWLVASRLCYVPITQWWRGRRVPNCDSTNWRGMIPLLIIKNLGWHVAQVKYPITIGHTATNRTFHENGLHNEDKNRETPAVKANVSIH